MVKNKIKELRQKNNLTLKELGQKIGMANNTISQYETGKREPKLETWQKLAKFFDVSVPYLQGLTNDKVYSESDINKLLYELIQQNSFSNRVNNTNPTFNYLLLVTDDMKIPDDINKFVDDLQDKHFVQNTFNFVFTNPAIEPLLTNAEYASSINADKVKSLLLTALDAKNSELMRDEKYFDNFMLNEIKLTTYLDTDHTKTEKEEMIRTARNTFVHKGAGFFKSSSKKCTGSMSKTLSASFVPRKATAVNPKVMSASSFNLLNPLSVASRKPFVNAGSVKPFNLTKMTTSKKDKAKKLELEEISKTDHKK